ncbi:MAG: DUF3313 domain-containing protein [Gammaproteobacteria bacterium]|nr:DUF3313 domain-containing protein [Gammaproteobacteria bacterium]MCP4091050.1 DUF3313 domain-containing protein [Gammaproteobacteria bacterium]MCP4831515.1 DUF3313 domain-containing protein [Gammaproteobacteria bacterium]MCP4927738.1 DUF3313 domain-containing protein [Gammaproteobacteria bacterium]
MRKTLWIFIGLVGLTLSISHAALADEEFAANVESLQPYYIKDGVDLSVYTKVLVDSLDVVDARVIAPPWYQGDHKKPAKWELSKKDIEFLRKSYRAAMLQELETKGGYPVVAEMAADVLILDMEIVTLMPYVRKGEKVQVRGFGEMTVQATLRDGMTGELLAIFEGSQDIGTEYQQSTRLNAENNLKALFQVWGARMRKVMDDNR